MIEREEPLLTGIGTCPTFAIGQRALLVQSPGSNVLWDCISLIDQPTIAAVNALGSVRAIAISHPHYYATMVESSPAFGAPIYLHTANREHVMRPNPAVEFWDGDTLGLWDGLALIRCGGHFAGGTVLHLARGGRRSGALLVGDILTVAGDRRYVSFMYSYPNLIPLSAARWRTRCRRGGTLCLRPHLRGVVGAGGGERREGGGAPLCGAVYQGVSGLIGGHRGGGVNCSTGPVQSLAIGSLRRASTLCTPPSQA